MSPGKSSLPTILSPARHAIFAFMISELLSFVQMAYQNKDFTPYDTHPVAIYTSICALFLYGISSIAEATLDPVVSEVDVLLSGYISDFSASLGMAFLASIVFPVPLRGLAYSAFTLIAYATYRRLSKIWPLVHDAHPWKLSCVSASKFQSPAYDGMTCFLEVIRETKKVTLIFFLF